MTVVQNEIRIAVIEQRIRPVGGSMAGFTFRAVAPLVIVLAEMTACASALEAIFEIFARMTVLTVQPAMSILQRESRFRDVIEIDAPPCRCPMAVGTHRAVSAAVNVVDGMTRDALHWRAGVNVSPVTVDAFHLGVRAGQGVPESRMIEVCIRPIEVGVTFLAGAAKRTFVDVVFYVAIRTEGRSVTVLFPRGVAISARGAEVRTKQEKITEIMVKQAAVYGHDIRVAALMIGKRP